MRTVVAPHRKRKAVRSQKQALSELAASIQQMASTSMKKIRLSMEADLKRDKMLLDFKREGPEKNREHELRMAQIFANAMASNRSPPYHPFQSPTPPPSLLHTRNFVPVTGELPPGKFPPR